jgi:hypothetical protein
MLATLLALLPLVSPQAPAADAARVKAAVTELDRAFKDGAAAERVTAIQAAASYADPEVIVRIAKGMRDKELDVERAAIEALRFMNHSDATKALVDAARKEPRLRKEPALFASLLRAIGQRADASTIEVLAEDIWTMPDYTIVQARVLSLGRIRTKASVEKLMELMRLAGQSKLEPYMETFRVALMVQTGVDQGTSQDAWLAWWTANKSKFVVPDRPAPLPKTSQYYWDVYWGENKPYDRPTKRADRGRGDPEK